MAHVGELYQRVESHKKYIEKYVKQMRLLFKPWPPPPQADKKDVSGVQEKSATGVSMETKGSSSPAITAEEHESLAMVDKLLHKAQKARDIQQKLEDSNKARIRRDPRLVAEGEVIKADQNHVTTTSAGKDTKPQTLKNSSVSKQEKKPQNTINKRMTNQKQTTAEKKIESRDKAPSQTLKQSGRVLNRPSSAQNRKNLQSSAPFQTDTRQTSAKLQTTYRATIAKTGAKLQAGSAKTGKRSATANSGASVGQCNPHQRGVENKLTRETKDNKHIRETEKVDKGSIVSDGDQNTSRESCDSSTSASSCDNKIDTDRLKPGVEGGMALLNVNNNARGDTCDGKAEESGADGDSAMFLLVKDGSTLKLPSSYRRALHNNRKLHQKLYAQHVTQKVNAPPKSQQFMDSCTEMFMEASVTHTHKQGELVKQLAKVYEGLHSLLDSLTLEFVGESSSPTVILRARKILEYILTKFSETEQLLHMADMSCLNTINTSYTSVQHKLPEEHDHSMSVWYPNGGSFLGSDRVARYRYRSYRQLEQYMTLVYNAQWHQLKLDLMDQNAKLILPLLRSLDPTSSEFVQVLRAGYSLLSTNPCCAPVVVKDSQQDTSMAESQYQDS